MAWTKITKKTDDADGTGFLNAPGFLFQGFLSQVGSIWTKITKGSDPWTKIAKNSDSWTKITKASL